LNLNELTVHQGRINSIAYLKEKSYLVSSSYDSSIIFWKTVSNINEINQLNGHLRQTEKVIKLTNSNYLVSASDDFTLKVSHESDQ
jgi:WD40 repeat protein